MYIIFQKMTLRIRPLSVSCRSATLKRCIAAPVQRLLAGMSDGQASTRKRTGYRYLGTVDMVSCFYQDLKHDNELATSCHAATL